MEAVIIGRFAHAVIPRLKEAVRRSLLAGLMRKISQPSVAL
jgi:hypothetical protein